MKMVSFISYINCMNKFLVVLILFIFNLGFAQRAIVPKKDVKVGLVLSGGGAKGFAHIGVLKVLEEAGIRIDYIAGTSMGAIIGGLYASGYRAHELDSILKAYDLNGLIQDELPREASSFYQKENDGKYAISFPLVNRKIELPSAVSSGQRVFNIFSQLTEHVHEVEDFSKLPIPFFCIATDLETGEEVVLDHGFLPEAIRASGSFPGLLTPVKMDGRILVDGGITNNFPVERMDEMGVDYIIGVNVSGGLTDRDNLNTLPEILIQVAGFQMYEKWDEEIRLTDIYIRPDLENYETLSFDKSQEITILGEEAANKNMTNLLIIASQQIKIEQDESIYTSVAKDLIVIKEIEINGNTNYTDNYCIDKLKIEVGKSISHKKFMKGIDALTATRNFESIYYKLIPVEGGTRVEFEILENETSTIIQFGAHYDDLYKTGILINLTKKHSLFKNDFLSADFIIGDNVRYNIDYFIENGFNWSVGINTRFNKFKQDLVLSSLPQRSVEDLTLKVPIEYNDFTTRLYVQTTLTNKLALRIGIEHKYLNIFTEEIIDDKLEKLHFDKSNYYNLFGKLTIDSYDTNYFPKKGFYFNTDYIVYLLSSNFNGDFNSFSQLYGKIGFAQSFYSKLTLHLISEAGITIENNGNEVLDYHLGGNNENFINTFVPFYGYDVADLNETAFIRTELTVRYELFKNNFVSFTGNFGRLNEDLWNNGDIFEDTISGYAIGYGLKSFIGPLEIKYSWTPDNSSDYWYFNIGFWF